ncbi:MAG: hypothetical protein IJZ91_00685 [Oscillospiraceae bacterium]|nr:hypothetical protein [Oscillospiraceae bacterium]
MARPHAKLRGAMMASDIDCAYIARKLLRGITYVSLRMSGHEAWHIDECYKILDMIHAPYSQLHEYFPPGGKAS